MLKYGCVEKWSKDMVQKKWYEMNPGNSYNPEYEDSRVKRRITDDYGIDSFSDGGNSLSYSPDATDNRALMPGQSNFVGNTRSRTGSVESTDYSIEQQVVHHLKFELQEL